METEPIFYWHIHHDVLLEVAYEPIEERIEFVKRHKHPGQREARLRLMKPVQGQLPQALIDAYKAHLAASKVNDGMKWTDPRYDSALRETIAARQLYNKIRDTSPEILLLHQQECPNCPWDGKTIFPYVEVGGQ